MTQSAELLEHIWLTLDKAATQGTGFTLGFLATLGVRGGPRVRATILRQFEQAPDRVYFATNAHSDKVAEIQQHPQVALTLYSDSVQLRLRGKASITDETERRAAWENLAPHSRQLYAPAGVSGQPLEQTAQIAEDAAAAFQRFAWVRVDLDHLDWLDLTTEPHLRWQFSRELDGWDGQRVVP